MKKRRKRTRSIVALILAVAFVVTQGVLPSPSALADAQGALPEVRLPSQFQLNLPPDLGTIQNLNIGTGPTLIHLQDAHGNYEAQKKIAEILAYLKQNYGIKLLLLEGDAAKLNPANARLFPKHMEITREVLDELAKDAIAQGEELFLLDHPDVEVYGIENLDAYVANGRSFKAVLTEQEKTGGFIRDMDMQIERLTGPYLNKDLRAFLKRLEDFEAKRLPMLDWLSFLKSRARTSLEIDLNDPAYQIDWPTLIRIFKLAEFESKIDMKIFTKERDEFLAVIARRAEGDPSPVIASSEGAKQSRGLGTGSAISEIASASLGTLPRNDVYAQIEHLLTSPISRHQLPDPETGLLFEKMVLSLPQDFDYNIYPNVKMFIGHLILQSEVKGEFLLEEMNRLSDQISEKLAKTEEEKKILTLLKDHRLLKRLFALELSPEDYDVIASEAKQSLLRPSQVIQRFVDLNGTKRVRDIEFTHTEAMDSLFEKAMEFYRGVKERDGWMLENIEARFKETGADKAVVITGGFHAEPFKNFFAQKNYNYALIAPKITTTDGREAYIHAALTLSTRKLPKVILGFDMPGGTVNSNLVKLAIMGKTSIASARRQMELSEVVNGEGSRLAGTRIERLANGATRMTFADGLQVEAPTTEATFQAEVTASILDTSRAIILQEPAPALSKAPQEPRRRAEVRAEPKTDAEFRQQFDELMTQISGLRNKIYFDTGYAGSEQARQWQTETIPSLLNQLEELLSLAHSRQRRNIKSFIADMRQLSTLNPFSQEKEYEDLAKELRTTSQDLLSTLKLASKKGKGSSPRAEVRRELAPPRDLAEIERVRNLAKQEGSYEEFEKVVKEIAAVNRRDLPNILAMLTEIPQDEQPRDYNGKVALVQAQIGPPSPGASAAGFTGYPPSQVQPTAALPTAPLASPVTAPAAEIVRAEVRAGISYGQSYGKGDWDFIVNKLYDNLMPQRIVTATVVSILVGEQSYLEAAAPGNPADRIVLKDLPQTKGFDSQGPFEIFVKDGNATIVRRAEVRAAPQDQISVFPEVKRILMVGTNETVSRGLLSNSRDLFPNLEGETILTGKVEKAFTNLGPFLGNVQLVILLKGYFESREKDEIEKELGRVPYVVLDKDKPLSREEFARLVQAALLRAEVRGVEIKDLRAAINSVIDSILQKPQGLQRISVQYERQDIGSVPVSAGVKLSNRDLGQEVVDYVIQTIPPLDASVRFEVEHPFLEIVNVRLSRAEVRVGRANEPLPTPEEELPNRLEQPFKDSMNLLKDQKSENVMSAATELGRIALLLRRLPGVPSKRVFEVLRGEGPVALIEVLEKRSEISEEAKKAIIQALINFGAYAIGDLERFSRETKDTSLKALATAALVTIQTKRSESVVPRAEVRTLPEAVEVEGEVQGPSIGVGPAAGVRPVPAAVPSPETTANPIEVVRDVSPESLIVLHTFRFGVLPLALTSSIGGVAIVNPAALGPISGRLGIPLLRSQAVGPAEVPVSWFQEVMGAEKAVRVEITQKEGKDLIRARFQGITPDELVPMAADDYWQDKISNPRPLYNLLQILDVISGETGYKQPLVVLVGDKKAVMNRLKDLLTNQNNGITDIEDRIVAASYAARLDKFIEVFEPNPGESSQQALARFLAENPDSGTLIKAAFEGLTGYGNFVADEKIAKNVDGVPFLMAKILEGTARTKGSKVAGAKERAEELLRAALIREVGIIVNVTPHGRQAIIVVRAIDQFLDRLRSERRITIYA